MKRALALTLAGAILGGCGQAPAPLPHPAEAALQRARADLLIAEARLRLAVSQAQRAERLIAQNVMPGEEREHRRGALLEAQARFDRARLSLHAAHGPDR